MLYFFSANDKRLHNGVTNPDGNEPSVHKAQLSDYSDYDYEEDNSSKEDEEDEEDYMREVKAIIGGVLGFWGGVGGLGTMFLGNESSLLAHRNALLLFSAALISTKQRMNNYSYSLQS